jgi:serine O-acetyltransferase
MKPCLDEHRFEAEIFVPSLLESFDRLKGPHLPLGPVKPLPEMQPVFELCSTLPELFFPGRCSMERGDKTLQQIVTERLQHFGELLTAQVILALYHENPDIEHQMASEQASHIVRSLAAMLGRIRSALKLDAQAGYDGDPAARSVGEVLLSYPFIKSLMVHRVAHELFTMSVPLIPRMMAECAHSTTGIDIHPGAKIGSSFFIDHGTGTVIGETTIIGDRVKLYQGVTIGALSFPRDGCGKLIRGVKRHPTIEDDVTIYANATILGDITIGAGSVIGSNVWIKESVEQGTMVTIAPPVMTVRPLS